MSQSNDVCLKFATAIEENFNNILSSAKIDKIEFDKICEIVEEVFQKIAVTKEKNEKAKIALSKI